MDLAVGGFTTTCFRVLGRLPCHDVGKPKQPDGPESGSPNVEPSVKLILVSSCMAKGNFRLFAIDKAEDPWLLDVT